MKHIVMVAGDNGELTGRKVCRYGPFKLSPSLAFALNEVQAWHACGIHAWVVSQ